MRYHVQQQCLPSDNVAAGLSAGYMQYVIISSRGEEGRAGEAETLQEKTKARRV